MGFVGVFENLVVQIERHVLKLVRYDNRCFTVIIRIDQALGSQLSFLSSGHICPYSLERR